MTTALAERQTNGTGPTVSSEQLDLVKRTVANGATPAELQLYLYDCQRQGVHPLDRLLHFTKRGGKYTPVTSIDLMRIRAAETGEYAGSDDAEFVVLEEFDEQRRKVESAKVTVWRLVQGTRCAFTATARWDEYYPGDQGGHMWRKMPHTMLGKCAEALALRKGFPRQLAGLYASEELDQAQRQAASNSAENQVAVDGEAVIDVHTGEEKPTPPDGYHYISDYSFRNGWHEFRLLNFDAQGGSIKLSTKKNIGSVAEQAQAEGIPVKVKTAPKRNATGEAYLDAIEKLDLDAIPSLTRFAKEPPRADGEIVPIDASDIPFGG